MRALIRPVHRGLVYVLTLGVLVQAVLAGQFISGTSDQLAAHGAVGGVLELLSLVLLLVAVAHRLLGERSRSALWGSIGLALALQLQAGLGWAPGAVPTSIHVPFGTATFAGAVMLSAAVGRHLGTDEPRATPDRLQPTTTTRAR